MRWFWLLVLVAGAGGGFALMRPCFGLESGCSGGSVRGVILGVAGLALILLSSAYLVRKQWARSMLLTLEHWLYLHVVLGVLALFLVVAHSGFHLQNALAALALLFLALTVASGAIGLAIFHWAPRVQMQKEAGALLPDDLSRRLGLHYEELKALCARREGKFREAHDRVVVPLYRTRVGQVPPSADLSAWAAQVSPEEQDDFFQLAFHLEAAHDLFAALRQHVRFRWIVRGWLLIHVPATIGLIVFAVAHVVSLTWLGVE